MTHSNSNWSGGGTGYPPNQMQNHNQYPQQQMSYQNQNPQWGQGGPNGQPTVVVQQGGNDGMMKGCCESILSRLLHMRLRERGRAGSMPRFDAPEEDEQVLLRLRCGADD
jgi:hypothetical protein